jgi:hypothetical protein
MGHTRPKPDELNASGSCRHPSFLQTRSDSLSRRSLLRKPTPVAIIQSGRGFSHFAFSRRYPTEPFLKK